MVLQIFDRASISKHKSEVYSGDKVHDVSYLLHNIADVVLHEMLLLNTQFKSLLNIGYHDGYVVNKVKSSTSSIITTDVAFNSLNDLQFPTVICDEEFFPFAQSKFDTIINIGNLHLVNDLPGVFIQIHNSLEDGGLFIGNLMGPKTLKELKYSCINSCCDNENVHKHIVPFVDIRDAGALLQRAHFTKPVVHSNTITVHYRNPLKLIKDLRDMGELDVLLSDATANHNFIKKILSYYKSNFSNEDGTVYATFEIITMIGNK